MVEISLSGSGEGPGSVTAPGYSTSPFFNGPLGLILTLRPTRSHPTAPDRPRTGQVDIYVFTAGSFSSYPLHLSNVSAKTQLVIPIRIETSSVATG